jgi:hypothetical protein
MIIIDNFKQGASLPMALIIVSFLGAISFSAYRMSEEQTMVAIDNNMRETAYQAAESAIQETLEVYNIESETGLVTLAKVETQPITRCIFDGDVIVLDEDSPSIECASEVVYGEDDVIAQSTTQRVNALCLTWGQSDKSIKCYQIVGSGQIPNTAVVSENVQEIQIIEIKQEDNGIYEF